VYADLVRRRERAAFLAALAGQRSDDSLDDDLLVASWPGPASAVRPAARVVAVDIADVPGLTPPAWWRDDEEASQSFLGAVGVRPE